MFGGSMDLRPLMTEIVADVGEEGAARFEAFHRLFGAVHRGMRGMRLVA